MQPLYGHKNLLYCALELSSQYFGVRHPPTSLHFALQGSDQLITKILRHFDVRWQFNSHLM